MKKLENPKGCATCIIISVIIGVVVAILTSGGPAGAFAGVMWGIAAACGAFLIVGLIVFFTSSEYKETSAKNKQEIAEKVAQREKERIAEEKRLERQKRFQEEKSPHIRFYHQCTERGVTEVDSPEGLKGLKIIGAANGITNIEEAKKSFLLGKKYAEEPREERSIEERELSFGWDVKKYNKEYGIAQIAGKLKYYGGKIDTPTGPYDPDGLKKTALQMANYQAPKSDWAIAGGLASGIAGPAAGVVTALDVQSKNAAAEAQAEEIRTAGLNLYVAASQMGHGKMSEDAKQRIELESNLKKALVDETDPEEKMQALHFENWKIKLNESGSFYVTVTLSTTRPTMLLNSQAILDGSLRIEILDQNDQTIAEGYYCAPGYDMVSLAQKNHTAVLENLTKKFYAGIGFPQKETISVLCIPKAPVFDSDIPIKSYHCKVSPVHLWLIEC